VNNPLGIKENDEHALDFALTSLTFFGIDEFGLFRWEGCCFVSGSPVITLDKKVASLEAIWRSSLQMLIHCRL
jgi:hypothetical protein